MKDFIVKTGGRSSAKLSNLDQESTAIWTTERVNKLLDDFENGMIDIKTIKNSPFKDNDPALRKANLVFEYTPDELEELSKCKSDPLYFAMKYAKIMTEEGIITTPLRDYQEEIIRSFKNNRFNILMASRQIGKTVMSGVFIAWFLIFHTDKNVLAVANVASTTKEVLDKIKSVIENLPFFMKPGCISNNVMSLKYDNGCRLIGRTTTKNTGIGFTIHLLYIDEFAHINPAYLNFFYRAIYPTVSAAKSTSKIIITSTPNGMNRFYEIYMDAMNHKNTYVPLRVDWWQVPGRDEDWKRRTIADMGSEEDFNQEFGLQFFSSDKLLLSSKDLKKIFNLKTEYKIPEWLEGSKHAQLLNGLTMHPNLSNLTPDDLRADGNQYVFSIDTADGLNRDYSVVNVFKLVALPISMLDKVKDFIRNEGDIFGLVQVASFRSNTKDINEFCNVIEALTYEVFNPEKVKLILELNHKGEYVMDKLEQNENFESNQVIYSKHTVSSTNWKPGLRLTETNKTKFCERFKYLIGVNKILPNEFKTVHELGAFGKSSNGNYRSQSGNDDLAMTCVNTAAFFESPNFWELVNEMIDQLPKEYIKEVYARYLDEAYVENASMYDHSTIRELNVTPHIKRPSDQNKIGVSEITKYQSVIESFYGKK